MKLTDLKVGVEYGASDEPMSRRGYGTPEVRRVELVEITTIEVKKTDRWTGRSTITNKKRPKIKVLGPAGNFRYQPISNAPEGTILTVDAKYIVGVWEDLAPAITAAIARKQALLEAQATWARRIKALGLSETDRRRGVDTNVRYYDSELDIDLHARGTEASTRLIELAEKGLAAEKGQA